MPVPEPVEIARVHFVFPSLQAIQFDISVVALRSPFRLDPIEQISVKQDIREIRDLLPLAAALDILDVERPMIHIAKELLKGETLQDLTVIALVVPKRDYSYIHSTDFVYRNGTCRPPFS